MLEFAKPKLPYPRCVTLCALLGAAALGWSLAGSFGARADVQSAKGKGALPQPPSGGELGFVLSKFAPAFQEGDEQCPDGLSNSLREVFLDSLPPAERSRLLLKENEAELERRWKQRAVGADGSNVCSNPERFDFPTIKTIHGRVAPGMDLDGDASGAGSSDSCAHENFTGADGGAGVDNQAYRALGCTVNWRNVDGKAGDYITASNGRLASGEHTIVMIIRGVDNLVNDGRVEIVFANTEDTPIADTRRNLISGASFTVTDVLRWRNVMTGHIANGVLLTDPADIRLTQKVGQGGLRGQKLEYDIRKGRLRLAFRPDGTIAGMMGGYQPVKSYIQATMLGGIGAATNAGIDCAGKLKTLEKLADGVRDPVTGKCTAASFAWDVEAVPAFVFDRAPVGKAATRPARDTGRTN